MLISESKTKHMILSYIDDNQTKQIVGQMRFVSINTLNNVQQMD